MKNIFAYTEPTLPDVGYVAYLSVNEIAVDSQKNIVITVRSRGQGVPQEVRLTREHHTTGVATMQCRVNAGTR